MKRPGVLKKIRYRANYGFGGKHANVDGPDLKIGGEFLKSGGNQADINRLDLPDPSSGLNGQGGDTGNPVALMGSNRLDVGGNARPGGRVKARYA